MSVSVPRFVPAPTDPSPEAAASGEAVAPAALAPGAVAPAKQALRTRLLAEREGRPLDHAAGLAAAAAAVALLDGLERRPPGVVAGYWPMRDEVDLRPALAALHSDGWQCALPVVAAPRQPLLFRCWQPGDVLRSGRFGVQEPDSAARAVVPDILLVPLLAFDDDGYRLGYGGGFYDRTLAALLSSAPRTLAIGVATGRQRHHPLPRESHDQPLPWLVTERGARQFGT